VTGLDRFGRIRFRVRAAIHARLADPDLQAQLLRWHPGRWLARRKAARVFDLTAGFVYSQTLLAVVQLDLLERLRGGPRARDALCGDIGVSRSRFEPLLQAAAALDLVMVDRDIVALGETGAGLLGNPGALAMIRHHPLLYRDLSDPLELLRSAPGSPTRTLTAGFWSYTGADPAQATPNDTEPPTDYSELMSSSQKMIAEEVLAAFDFRGCQRVVDIGGGEGAFAQALLAHHPSLKLRVFDLPEVVERARRRTEPLRPPTPIDFIGGDFRRDPLPPADLITLVRVLHDHDEHVVRGLLQRIHQSLPPGGRLLVAEPMAGAHPGVDAYFACYFLAMGQGRLRSPEEIRGLLTDAGFGVVTQLRGRLPMLARVLLAKKEC
jgi:demethylspheroidene O-methyltransferase